MNLRKEQAAFLLGVCNLILFATEQGFELTSGELLRTREQQKIYFDTNKSKTLNSNHLRRLAIDLMFFENNKLIFDKKVLQPVGDYWEGLHLKNKQSGNFAPFTDTPHFERNARRRLSC